MGAAFVVGWGRGRVRAVVAGSVRPVGVGPLLVLLVVGSVRGALALLRVRLFCSEVLPHLRGIWDDEGWENRWWPQRLRGARNAPPAPAQPGWVGA
ncbi:hypothetical protein SAMN04487939_103247 [Lysobacter sp. yr284]|nr:hypothetical protein SAMN04487939_103247 [Lysobacter sp. yr284]